MVYQLLTVQEKAPLILPGLTTSLFDRLKTLLPAIRVTSPVNLVIYLLVRYQM
jgi:hypothetical protein